MSSALRKRVAALEAAAAEGGSSSEEEGSGSVSSSSGEEEEDLVPQASAFALLLDEDDVGDAISSSSSEEEEEDDEEQGEDDAGDAGADGGGVADDAASRKATQSKSVTPPANASAGLTKAQRKRQRQRAARAAAKQQQQQPQQNSKGLDEVDAALSELGLADGGAAAAAAAAAAAVVAADDGGDAMVVGSSGEFGGASDPLAVSNAFLDPENELVRVFGAETVRSVKKEQARDEMDDIAAQYGLSARGRQGRVLAARAKQQRQKERQKERLRDTAGQRSGAGAQRVVLMDAKDAWPPADYSQYVEARGAGAAAAGPSGQLEAPGFSMEHLTAEQEADALAEMPEAAAELVSSARKPRGGTAFRIAWSRPYLQTQRRFFACERTHNPGTLQTLLHRENWWHTDSLLRLSDVSRLSGDNDSAVDFLHRAIYALQMAWQRTPGAGLDALSARRARVPFALPRSAVPAAPAPRRAGGAAVAAAAAAGGAAATPERDANKTLFVALLQHAQQLARQGCSRTALEVCKLLLLLDWPRDPVGALLLADTVSLRCREFRWLVDLVCSAAPDTPTAPPVPAGAAAAQAEHARGVEQLVPMAPSLHLVPSYAFSAALARFLYDCDMELDTVDQPPAPDRWPSADALLQHALCTFPAVLREMAEKHDLTAALGMRPPAAAGGGESPGPVVDHPFFAAAAGVSGARGAAEVAHKPLEQLVKLYTDRAGVLWKPTRVGEWLRRNALVVLGTLDGPDGDVVRSTADAAAAIYRADTVADASGAAAAAAAGGSSAPRPPAACEVMDAMFTHLCLTETADTVVQGALPPDIVAELQAGAGGVAVMDDWRAFQDEYADEEEEEELPQGAGGNPLGLFLNSLVTPHHTRDAEGQVVEENWVDTFVDLMRRATVGAADQEEEGEGDDGGADAQQRRRRRRRH